MKPTYTITLSNLPALSQKVAKHLASGDSLGLIGDLGAGKTTFVKHLAQCFDIDPQNVTSPTYVYHHIYEGSQTLHHMDLYRILDSDLIDEMGLAQAQDFQSGIVLVEWVDRFSDSFDRSLDMVFQWIDEDHRKVTFVFYPAFASRKESLLKDLAQQ